MKTNVLVPMAGLGSRFLKEGFTVPKQLINIKDKQLIDISLDCLDTKDCNLIFIIRDEHVYNFRMDEILRMKFGDDIKVVNIEGGYYASIIYSGRSTDKNFIKHKNILEKELLNNNISIISPPIRATYNSPFTLPMLRRNEAMFKIVF